ncbi:MAG TPA: 2,3,4,5-tetrahydropyridine-2,6-dicarboxylate N-succinyltransferase [Gemmatimonadaceae bacterium]|nr:2,3,4,5-tetrahydropyridine-2,6-dicarboxylate N-succinyltransferase [Gemmatimonadaceae bacterium]
MSPTPAGNTSSTLESLEQRIESAASASTADHSPDTRPAVEELLQLLESGEVRSAERDANGKWSAVPWVKRGILLGFRIGKLIDMSPDEVPGSQSAAFSFFDKDIFPLRELTLRDNVRVVPGGSSIRRGTYVAPGVVCMPPMYINVGAYVGAGTMVDSHALVGSCAQIGERVHLSAAAQIGGVLEPVNAVPVVIEDDVIVGGNCGIFEGTVVRSRAVIGAGVVLTRGTPVYDLVREEIYRAEGERSLEIPSGAVVVPGARRIKGGWGEEERLSLQTPVIVKYRDEKTDHATALESWLR